MFAVLPETVKIIESALRLDSTLDDKQRAAIKRNMTAGIDQKPRVRIPASTARRILGLSRTTWHRRKIHDSRYKGLCAVTDGPTTYYYLDEIESLRDGHAG